MNEKEREKVRRNIEGGGENGAALFRPAHHLRRRHHRLIFVDRKA